MKVKDIFTDSKTKIFVVTNNHDDDDALNWDIEPTDFELLPGGENIYMEGEDMYIVKALQVFPDRVIDCFLYIGTPERIAETVIMRTATGQVVSKFIYDVEGTVIPAIASDLYGVYELYYAKENPQVGIDVLKNGLGKAKNKYAVAEDLGYILRDEGRIEEAIEAFKISEENGASSQYIYSELAELYRELGQTSEQLKYEQKCESTKSATKTEG